MWGAADAVVEPAWRTSYRSGIGGDLAEGSWRLASKYGASEESMTVRKQELPAYDPRGAQVYGLACATNNRGGRHLRAYMISPEVLGVTALVREFQDMFALTDSMVVCRFSSFAIWDQDCTYMIAAVTGWDFTKDEVHKAGEKNLQCREGLHHTQLRRLRRTRYTAQETTRRTDARRTRQGTRRPPRRNAPRILSSARMG